MEKIHEKIAVTGSNGLIGSRFINLLNKNYNLSALNTDKGFDITDSESIRRNIEKINPSIIVHFAAKTDVDSCEKDKMEDIDKLSRGDILNNGKINVQNIN